MNTERAVFPIDLTDPEFLTGDRTSAYKRLRESGAAIRLAHGPDFDTWVLSRHADAREILRLPRGRVQPVGTDAPAWLEQGPALDRLRANLVQLDDPGHARLRKLVGPMFIPRRVEEFRRFATASVDRAIAKATASNDVLDAVRELAVDIPRGVICQFLGIPEDDWVRLTENQHDFLLIFSPVPLDHEGMSRLNAITDFYMKYFDEFLNSRALRAHTPFVRLLLEAEQAGELSRTETLSLVHTILDAGYETTRTSISNLIEMLGQRRKVFDTLRTNPDAVPAAVDELLRFKTPLHVRERYLVEDLAASDGTVIPGGSRVLVMIAAANRDPAVFVDADRFDLRRGNANAHLAFGGGMHHCLGAPIARIQLQETIRGLTSAFDRIEIAEPGRRLPDLIFPALTSLPVVLHRAA
jgi:cytochrome P450